MFDLVSERTCNLAGKPAGQARLRVTILLILLFSSLETSIFVRYTAPVVICPSISLIF